MRSYLEVVGRPIVSRLFAASIFNNIVIATYLIALTITIYSEIPNTLILGIIMSIPALASFLAPVTGHIVDSHKKKNVVTFVRTTDVFIFLAIGVVIALHIPFLIIAFGLLAFVIEINDLIREQAIATIYQLHIDKNQDAIRLKSIQGATYWATHAIMPAVTGFLIASYGSAFLFMLIALLVLPQVALYSSLKFQENLKSEENRRSLGLSLKDSAHALKLLYRESPAIALLIIVPLLHAFFTVANYVLLVALIYRFSHFAIDYGVIASVGIAGNAIGTIFAGVTNLKRGRTILLIFATSFLADVPVGIDPTFYVMLAFLTLGGFLYFIVSTQFQGLKLTMIPREYYGRISGIISLLTGISTVAGTIFISWLALTIPARLLYLISVSLLTMITASLLLSGKLRKTEIASS